MTTTTLEYVLAVIVIVLGLCVLFVAFYTRVKFYRAEDLGSSLDSRDDDNYADEDEDPDEGAEVHYTITSIPRDLVMGGGDKSSDVVTSTDACKILDFDDFMSLSLLSEETEDDEDDDNDLLAETLVRLAVIDDYDGFVDDMLEKTNKIMKHITNIQVALKREEDEDNVKLFVELRHHLQQQMQDYRDIVETVNKYVGKNVDYTDAVVAIEGEIAKVEGYNL